MTRDKAKLATLNTTVMKVARMFGEMDRGTEDQNRQALYEVETRLPSILVLHLDATEPSCCLCHPSK